jgi:DEAD/DEAH box helicase domain-containing protein
MAKLQAATISNIPINRKRKRKTAAELAGEVVAEALDSSATVPTKDHDGGSKPARRAKGGAKAPLLRRSSSTNLIESDVPWPDHFTYLNRLHGALNLVYTFCCTRKHFATTWDNIKSTVEGHIKRPLVVEDVAQVKALMPRAINFAYVDEEHLLVTIMGEEDGVKGGRADHFRSLQEDESERKEKADGRSKELLLFEFVDGDLKRQVVDPKTGLPTKATTKLRNEELKMPVFSQKSMLKLIEKRNVKFKSAINAHLNRCAADTTDPVEEIMRMREPYIPVPAEEVPEVAEPDRKGAHRIRMVYTADCARWSPRL